MAEEGGAFVPATEILEFSNTDKRRMLHTVYRVGNLKKTIKFYTECLGMKLLRQRDILEEKYSNAFLGYGPEDLHEIYKSPKGRVVNVGGEDEVGFVCSDGDEVNLNCDHWFDVVAVSTEMEAENLNPTIFLRACELLGVKPEEAVHVGDYHRNDIWGARDVGYGAWLWGNDVYYFKEILFPLGRTSRMVYGVLALIIFCGYIIYD